MWFSTPSVDTLTRPRVAVALISTFAAISIGYYTYQSSQAELDTETLGGSRLHRSNAIRRTRRQLQRNTDAESSSSSEQAGDENVNTTSEWQENGTQPQDGETVIEEGLDDWWNDPNSALPNQRTGHNIVNLLFRVSEDNAKRTGCVHRGCQCNACGMVPIRGIRYRCANCADFDLCETCESQGTHIKTHIFYKIRVPAPPFGPRHMQAVWYTGDPDATLRNLPRPLISKLTRETGFERPELEAFWEQWTFMANTEWRDDPDGLELAMDRKTFERCLVPTGGSRHAAPNLVHDRMFSFYDSNNDDLIGFSEFLQGLSYRKRKDKLRKVFEGYDIDGDGYVDRRDFLRMFRAYYVLYKQIHKDILDGLEDQLLSSTEAQQLVTNRQPLSSLFGRDGRIPSGDRGIRLEGKMYHQDGSVDIANGFHSSVVDNRADTSTREDILTSLFACDTESNSRRRLIMHRDNDSEWRIVRRVSGQDISADELYWRTLLAPPTTLQELPGIILNSRHHDSDETDEELEFEEPEPGDDGAEANATTTDDPEGDYFADRPVTESEARGRILEYNRRREPKLDKRRRDMARSQLHERWKRRQFYLDEEEGGRPPQDWDDDEDILVNLREMTENVKATAQAQRTRSRSSSKVRFAEDLDDDEIRSNPSTSSRSVPERWGGMEVPIAERDAGKEVLYQVTQQAFNELLDTIFLPGEEIAMDAAKTKTQRAMWQHLVDEFELPAKEETQQPEVPVSSGPKPISDRSLPELLARSGYTIDQSQSRRNGFEINGASDIEQSSDDEDEDADPNADYETTSVESDDDDELLEYRDPTLPQFRPNGPADEPEPGLLVLDPSYPLVSPAKRPQSGQRKGSTNPWTIPEESDDQQPTPENLAKWKRLEIAEKTATERGGWGKLSFEEFEQIYKTQESLGNRLDYLGSWIEFCIP